MLMQTHFKATIVYSFKMTEFINDQILDLLTEFINDQILDLLAFSVSDTLTALELCRHFSEG